MEVTETEVIIKGQRLPIVRRLDNGAKTPIFETPGGWHVALHDDNWGRRKPWD